MKLSDAAVAPGSAPRVAQSSGQTKQLEARPSEDVQDKVSVSTIDSAALEAARASVSDSRSTRVQEIVNAVRSGQYYPSPQQIAQKLVSEAEVEARLRALLAK